MQISKQLLYKYETNKVQRVPSDIIEKVADICHVDPWDIMGWDTNEHKSTEAEDPKLTKFKELVEQLSDEDVQKVYELAQLLLMAEKNN